MADILDFFSAKNSRDRKKLADDFRSGTVGRPPLQYSNSPKRKVWLDSIRGPFRDLQLHIAVPGTQSLRIKTSVLHERGFNIFRFRPGAEVETVGEENHAIHFFLNEDRFSRFYTSSTQVDLPPLWHIFHRATAGKDALDDRETPFLCTRNITSVERSRHHGIYDTLPIEKRFLLNPGDFIVHFDDKSFEKLEPFEALLRLRRVHPDGHTTPILTI